MGRTYTASAIPMGGLTLVPMRSAPMTSATLLMTPRSDAKVPWKAMFRAARSVTRKSSFSADSNTAYFRVGPTKQLVWPYLSNRALAHQIWVRTKSFTHMVSGLRVAATIQTFLPPTAWVNSLDILGPNSRTSILTAVYSCGLTASPLCLSWSIQG